MEVGWGTSLRLAGRTHTHVSVQASHALFNLNGVADDPKLSLGVRLPIVDLLPIRTEFEHLLVRSDDGDDDDDYLWVLH
jgi:hypothetical protein